jgi:hypothetical protein
MKGKEQTWDKRKRRKEERHGIQGLTTMYGERKSGQ